MNTSASDSVSELILSLDPSAGAAAIVNLADRLSNSPVTHQSFTNAAVLAQTLHQCYSTKAEPLSVPALDDAQRVLLVFLIKAASETKPTDFARFTVIVSISEKHDKVAQALLANILHVLQYNSSSVKAGSTAAVTQTVILADIEDVAVGQSNASMAKVEVLQALAILKVMAWSHHGGKMQISVAVVARLLEALGDASAVIAKSAQETLIAITCRSDTIHSHSHDVCCLKTPGMSDMLWKRVQKLCSDLTNVRLTTSGYSLWASLTHSHGHCFLPLSTLNDEQYWTSLRAGLSYGTAQQRKTCLYILKLSLPLLAGEILNCPSMSFHPSTFSEMRNQFSRYSTLFETIVLARYLNQVQDCLTDLTIMTQSAVSVGSAWLIALLTAALGSDIQDSVRKIIGGWTMQIAGPRVLLYAPELTANFLEHSFLPWATLGFHFTSSISTAHSESVCHHGEQLMAFLAQLLIPDTTGGQRQAVVKAVLGFIQIKCSQMFPFARAYVLEGLLRGVTSCGYELDEQDLESVVHISSYTGFNEIARDLMIMQCGRLAAYRTVATTQVTVAHSLLRKFSALREIRKSKDDQDTARVYLENTAQSPKASCHSMSDSTELVHTKESGLIAQLNIWIKKSRSKCLVGSGLVAAVIYLLHCLDVCLEKDLDFDALAFALRAIWEQYEIDDYPRNAALMIPRAFLHPKCVVSGQANGPLLTLISSVLLDMQKVVQHRIYALSPFAASLRSAIRERPDILLLPLRKIFVDLANNPPTTKVEFELEAVIAPLLSAYVPFRTYKFYYGESEGYALASLYDALNQLCMVDGSIDIRRGILDDLLSSWLHQIRPVPASCKWKTTAQLQTMLILSESLIPILPQAEVDQYLKHYHGILALEQMPRYRYLLEWIIARIYVSRSERRTELLDSIREPDLANSKNVASLMKLALMVAGLPDAQEEFAFQLFTEITVLAACPKIVIRHEAHWLVPLLWSHSAARNWRNVLDNPVFARLNEHIRSSEVYKNPPAGRLLERFDPIEDHTLSNLFQGQYLDIEPREPRKVAREDFLRVWKDDEERGQMQHRTGDTGLLRLGNPRAHEQALNTPSSTPPAAAAATPTEGRPIPLQTKATTWQDLDSTTLSAALGSQGRKARDIIVVASLIDNPHNLGGLSRISEIFGVQSLLVANPNIVGSKDFTAVAVSSHLWLPIEQLKVEAMPEYLVRRKLDGYTVVGIEQTDSSEVLGQGWEVPRRVVLVLGSERQGIPAWLLALMDGCVEVRQVGVTRSMNVQTAAAVVLYEYARQHP